MRWSHICARPFILCLTLTAKLIIFATRAVRRLPFFLSAVNFYFFVKNLLRWSFSNILFSAARFRNSLLNHAVAFWVFLYFLFYWWLSHSHSVENTWKEGLLPHRYVYLFERRGKTKTPPAAAAAESTARGHMNICRAFPYLLALTYFSISLILLLCDCQILTAPWCKSNWVSI